MEKAAQVNISLPISWKTKLDQLARIRSVKEEKDIFYHDLIREAVLEKFGEAFKK